MRSLVEQLRSVTRGIALVALVCGGLLAPVLAEGVINVELAVAEPGDDGVVRFSVTAAGVPEFGLSLYALRVCFEGPEHHLVESINTIITSPPRL